MGLFFESNEFQACMTRSLAYFPQVSHLVGIGCFKHVLYTGISYSYNALITRSCDKVICQS